MRAAARTSIADRTTRAVIHCLLREAQHVLLTHLSPTLSPPLAL